MYVHVHTYIHAHTYHVHYAELSNYSVPAVHESRPTAQLLCWKIIPIANEL